MASRISSKSDSAENLKLNTVNIVRHHFSEIEKTLAVSLELVSRLSDRFYQRSIIDQAARSFVNRSDCVLGASMLLDLVIMKIEQSDLYIPLVMSILKGEAELKDIVQKMETQIDKSKSAEEVVSTTLSADPTHSSDNVASVADTISAEELNNQFELLCFQTGVMLSKASADFLMQLKLKISLVLQYACKNTPEVQGYIKELEECRNGQSFITFLISKDLLGYLNCDLLDSMKPVLSSNKFNKKLQEYSVVHNQFIKNCFCNIVEVFQQEPDLRPASVIGLPKIKVQLQDEWKRRSLYCWKEIMDNIIQWGQYIMIADVELNCVSITYQLLPFILPRVITDLTNDAIKKRFTSIGATFIISEEVMKQATADQKWIVDSIQEQKVIKKNERGEDTDTDQPLEEHNEHHYGDQKKRKLKLPPNSIAIEFHGIIPAFLWNWNSQDNKVSLNFFEMNPESIDPSVKIRADGYLTCTCTAVVPIQKLRRYKGKHEVVYQYCINTDGNWETENVSLTNIVPVMGYLQGKRKKWRNFTLPKNICAGKHYRKFDFLTLPTQCMCQNGEIQNVAKFLHTHDEVLTKQKILYDSDKDMIMWSLRIHLLPMLEYNRMLAELKEPQGLAVYSEKLDQIKEEVCEPLYSVEIHEGQVEGKQKKFPLQKEFKQEFRSDFVNYCLERSDLGKERLLFGAAFAIIITKFDLLKQLGEEECSKMAEILVFRCTDEDLECFKLLEKNLSSKVTMDLVKASIKELCVHIITVVHSLTWIRAVSVYHFLCGSHNIKHDVKSISWKFWSELKTAKKNIQEHVNQSKQFSFSRYVSDFDDQLKHDFALQRVLLYVCPPDDLKSLISKTLPLIGISYIIYHFKDVDTIHDSESIDLLTGFVLGIQTAINLLCTDEGTGSNASKDQIPLIFRGCEVLAKSLSKKLFHSKCQKIVLKIINLLLNVVNLFTHSPENVASEIRFIGEVFLQWIKHPSVVGGTCFGGSRKEVDAWNGVLHVPDNCRNEVSSCWKNTIISHLSNRLSLVDKKNLIKLIMNVLDMDCEEEVVDVFIRVGVEGLHNDAVIPDLETPAAENNLRKIIFHSFKEQVKTLYFTPDKGAPDITLEILLSWKLWPVCMKLWKKGHFVKDSEQKLQMVAIAAVTFVHKLVTSIKFGEITLGNLQNILTSESQINVLISSANEALDLKLFASRLTKFLDHEKAVGQLLDMVPKEYKGYAELDAQMQECVENKPMTVLCPDWNTDGKIYVRCSSMNESSPIYRYLNCFYTLANVHQTSIFRKFWMEAISKQSAMEHLDQVWESVYQNCQHTLKTFMDGTMQLKVLHNLINSLDAHKVSKEMLQLSHGLNNCTCDTKKSPINEKILREMCNKVDCYHQAEKSSKTAKLLLELSKRLGYQSSCKLLSEISQNSNETTNEFKICDVTDQYFAVGESLRQLSSSSMQSLLEALFENWEIVTWIKTSFKEIEQLSTFVDVALTSSEDVFATTKLGALRIVGNAIVCLVVDSSVVNGINISATDQEDNSQRMIRLCEELKLALDQHTQLPSFVVQCNENLEWFKSIEATQGNENQTTLRELKDISARGCFMIGDKNDKLLCNISEAICLHIQNNKKLKVYSLTDLQDFERRLVILSGQNEENTKEVRRFLNVFHTVTIVAEVLCSLHSRGCVNFIGWEYTFRMESGSFEVLQKESKDLWRELQFWDEAIEKCRDECYLLNSFTANQILLLRKELKVYCSTSNNFSCFPQSFKLLRSVFPCLSVEDIAAITKSSSLPSDNYHIVAVDEYLDSDTECSSSTEAVNGDTKPGPANLKLTNHEDIVDKYFSSVQQKIYIALTANYRFDSLWAIVEIFRAKIEPTTKIDVVIRSIGDKMLEQEENDDDVGPDVATLIEEINNYLKEANVALETDKSEELETLSSTEQQNQSENVLPKPCLSEDETIDGMIRTGKADYLSLYELSSILNDAMPKYKGMRGCRNIIGLDIKPGSPNLFVIPKENILTCSILVYANDNSKPLPTNEEVLVCTEHTTAEEVILFWRRCIFDPSFYRVFTLLHGEKLKYSVCEESLKQLFKLRQGKKDYRLVILCTDEGDIKSHLVTSLHDFKRANPQTLEEDTGRVKKYLERHLMNPNNVSLGTAPALIHPVAHLIDPQRAYVRIVRSSEPGNGKTLYIKRLGGELKRRKVDQPIVSIPIHGPLIPFSWIMDKLDESSSNMIIHLDISTWKISQLPLFLFSFLILGHFNDSKGRVWRREISQMYCVEITLPESLKRNPLQRFLDLFPSVYCSNPSVDCSQTSINREENKIIVGLDSQNLKTEEYKLVYYYLKEFHKGAIPDKFTYKNDGIKDISSRDFMKVILNEKEARSWAEINHYIRFLYHQLLATQSSIFCDVVAGIKQFVVKMMINMAKEFSSSSVMGNLVSTDEIQKYKIKNSWNDSFHPYLFFNDDKVTMTFFGFFIKQQDAVNPVTNEVIIPNVMTTSLYREFHINRVNLNEDYRTWKRGELLDKLSKVVGSFRQCIHDPDPSYVITADNVMKMLAIIMRFRCGIPVVVMGETGCGKTRLLKYLCDIVFQGTENKQGKLIVLKVHGGTAEKDIVDAVREAEKSAGLNDASDDAIKTVLFFDEANTTEHIGLIKEIMCDHKMFGEEVCRSVRVVAAINPYRRHSEEMIKKIRSAGLGFFTDDQYAQEKLGTIPLRELVYRVHEMPESMLPLIFDFGRLDVVTEREYIREIVKNKIQNIAEQNLLKYADSIAEILSFAQELMRQTNGECSYVSLRDIERAMIVFDFFIINFEHFNALMLKEAATMEINLLKCKVTKCLILTLSVCYSARLKDRKKFHLNIVGQFKSPLAKLKDVESFDIEVHSCQLSILNSMKFGGTTARNAALRENVFMMFVCISLRIPLFLVGKPGSSKSLAKSIILNSMKGQYSANEILKKMKEVQLFPYQCSQYSTSGTILDAFEQAKVVQDQHEDKSKFVSVVVLEEVGLAEDSPGLPLKVLHPLLEDGTHQGNNYSVEAIARGNRVAFIGISNWALDPAKMNRGLMVTRCDPTEDELVYTAKEICSQKEMMDELNDELLMWLEGYFLPFAKAYLEISNASLKSNHRDFFGLRDFYSLVKMLYWMCKRTEEPPTWQQMEHCIKRNFGGYKKIDPVKYFKKYIHLKLEASLNKEEYRKKWDTKLETEYWKDPVVKAYFRELFETVHEKKYENIQACRKAFETSFEAHDLNNEELNEKLKQHHCTYKRKFDVEIWPFIINPPLDLSGLIQASLRNKERTLHGESRYLLFLTENYSALQTLTHFLETPAQHNNGNTKAQSPYIVFGSSFPKDRNYTQVCHNLHSIKHCMQTGRPVVLLNLDHLYESLYDALNQHYAYHGGHRFIDLGLQTQRYKCSVHDDFKLILIAEKQKVYNQFPTPLINRLEKHFVVTSDILTDEQQEIRKQLEEWIKKFSPSKTHGKKFNSNDAFVGFHGDTSAAVVFKATQLTFVKSDTEEWKSQVMEISKKLLLQLITPDAFIRLLISEELKEEYSSIVELYQQQRQSSLVDFLSSNFEKHPLNSFRIQVTTYSELLSRDEISAIDHKFTNLKVKSCVLEEFDTEFAFSTKVREAFQEFPSLLIIQCNSGHLKSDLIACAKYKVDDIQQEILNVQPSLNLSHLPICHVLFIVLIPREQSNSSFVGFLGGKWICAHIDELFPKHHQVVSQLLKSPRNVSLSSLFYDGESIEVEDPNEATSIKISGTNKNVNYHQYLYTLIQSAIHKACTSFELTLDVHKLNEILYLLLTDSRPQNRFFQCLVIHIWEYIKQREKHETKWLINASMNPVKLAEGGAFRQVVLRVLDEFIVSVFSKVIVYVSQAANLLLLNTESECIRNFWNSAFACSEICSFRFDVFDDSRYTFRNSAHKYNCQFPFSWIIVNEVQEVIQDYLQNDAIDDATRLEMMSSSLACTPVGKLLVSVNKDDFREMQKAYTADLIQLYFPNNVIKQKYVRSERRKLLDYTLWKNYLQNKNEIMDSFVTFVCISHHGIHQLSSSVKLFDQVIVVMPSILPKIMDSMMQATTESCCENISLDQHACALALNELDSENQTNEKWLISKLHQFHQLFYVIDKLVKNSPSFKSQSVNWLRIHTVHLFIEHVIMKFPQYINFLVPSANTIRTFMENVTSKVDFLKKIENILNRTLRKFSEIHERDTDHFIEQCTIFYIELILKLTIGEASAEDDLMKKLFENIFPALPNSEEAPGTRDLTPFLRRKGKDDVPVLRSFLLQLLIRKNAENHVTKYFDKANEVVLSQGGQEMIQLKLLYCKLFEDAYHERLLQIDSYGDKVQYLTESLKECEARLHPGEEDLHYLQWVATTRYILHYFTTLTNDKYYANHYAEHSDASFDAAYEQLLPVVRELCLKDPKQEQAGPQILLLKQLYRRIGEIQLKELYQHHHMNWIIPKTFHFTGNSLVDCFAVYGEPYHLTKQIIFSDNYKSIILNSNSAVLLGLCIFSEITQAYGQPDNELQLAKAQALSKEVVGVNSSIPSKLKECLLSLLNNAFCGREPYSIESLYVTDKQSQMDKLFSSVIIHSAIVLISKGSQGLFTLFHLLLNSPKQLKDYYLPTMPEDPFEVVQEVLKGQYYLCCFGHPYIITECGRPWMTRTCNECAKEGKRVEIGGERHVLVSDGKKDNREHRSQTGYILGVPAASPCVPERKLTKASFLILQALLHSMFIWTICNNKMQIKGIHQVVRRSIKDVNLPSFFWEHFKSNITDLHNVISTSFEDTVLLLHLVIQRIFEEPMASHNTVQFNMTTRDGRQSWEQQFDESYIQPVLKDLFKSLEDARTCIANMKKQSLLNVVLEKDASEQNFQHCLWKYHPQITLEMIHRMLRTSKKDRTHSSLDFFLNEEPSLRATKYLPSIVKLQRYLYYTHHCRYSQTEIQEKTIGKFINSHFNNDVSKKAEFICYLEDTSKAWALVKGKLQNYGQYSVQEKHIAIHLDMNVSLAYLVPNMTEEGRITISLIEYLVEVHNRCIYQCESLITSLKAAGVMWRSIWKDRTVELKDLQVTDLILYEERLKAVMLAHTHYSLVIGQGSAEIEFDFAAMEKQILDDFVYNKPRIAKKKSLDVVSFREDVYKQRIFQNIREKVNPQVGFSASLKKDLLNRLERIQQLRLALDHINIVMGFLSAGGKERPHMPIVEYAAKYLRIIGSDKTIGNDFNLEHTLAVWNVVSLELAKKRTIGSLAQSPFQVKECFLKQLPPKIVERLNEKLRQVNVDTILGELNDFIEIHVRNADDNEANWNIYDCIINYLDEPSEEIEQFVKECLTDIEMSHIVDVWVKIVLYQDEMKKLS